MPIESVGKQRLQQSSKHRVNKHDEETLSEDKSRRKFRRSRDAFRGCAKLGQLRASRAIKNGRGNPGHRTPSLRGGTCDNQSSLVSLDCFASLANDVGGLAETREFVIARSTCDEAIQLVSLRGPLDCFAELSIRRAFRATRWWLAMTGASHAWLEIALPSAACAAASRAIGTR
jgi:hypothetical protein